MTPTTRSRPLIRLRKPNVPVMRQCSARMGTRRWIRPGIRPNERFGPIPDSLIQNIWGWKILNFFFSIYVYFVAPARLYSPRAFQNRSWSGRARRGAGATAQHLEGNHYLVQLYVIKIYHNTKLLLFLCTVSVSYHIYDTVLLKTVR